ncbi:MAG: ABC transporter ATP-binding protein [Planctomycetota bacterium]|nr:ABC transporter ATP-binding protein [Planctomycetota bacterium]
MQLAVRNIHKTYRLGRVSVPVLRGVDLDAAPGEFVAVLGASGSGKSTLLHLIGGLDRPDRLGPDRAGERLTSSIRFGDIDVTSLRGSRLDIYRASSVGIVFQFYHLFPELNVLENVVVSGMVRRGWLGYAASRIAVRRRSRELLDAMGLSHRLRHRPVELSGGERQRVAIARALLNDPPLLLADEPTGNLDRATGEKIMDLLESLRTEKKKTLIVVTHDPAIAARASRVVRLADGRVDASADARGGASEVARA